MTNAQIPSYSGVTINISNPTVTAVPYQNGCPTVTVPITQPQGNEVVNPTVQTQQNAIPQIQGPGPQTNEQLPQAYPPSYYINDYNYTQNGKQTTVPQMPAENNTQNPTTQDAPKEEDMSASSKIIDELNTRDAKQKEVEENGKQVRVVALTDEYIMSLENYLNNQNTDIRLMAAKEVLTRLDEDKTRYDDAALNALLNKMLQDPQKLIRIAALSAFSSGLASGNDYTVQLLNNIQQNPNSDKEDVVEAANILLKMSGDTEVRYVNPNQVSTLQQQQKLQQQMLEQQKIIKQLQSSQKADK